MSRLTLVILASIFFMVTAMNSGSEAKDMSEQNLSAKQKSIITIAAFTANGDLDKLKIALNNGLNAGFTINEINEVLIQMYAYTGFPRSLNAISTFMAVIDERKSKGIKDKQGDVAKVLPSTVNKSEYGEKVRTEISGAPAKARWQEFAPGIELFLKEHLFADIFARDILDYKSRELATVAALSSLNGVNSQLQSHLNMAMNVGITEHQMNELTEVIKLNVGEKEGNNAKEVLKQVISNKK